MAKTISVIIGLMLIAVIGKAENVVSFYGGLQGSPRSDVSGDDHQGNAFNFSSVWEGNSLSAPPYYGIRYTHWFSNDTGLSLDFAHSKVYADDATLNKTGFETLEFSDGLNVLTLNYLKRYPEILNGFTPYWGLGAGITIPHVEVQTASDAPKTFEYQLGGYALQAQTGIEKALSSHWGLFVEYKFNYTRNSVDLDGGGKLEMDIMINALNLGVNYSF